MKINIIGGGTSGWWTAGYLRKNHPNIDITLIESPNIPTVGVGESTMPNVRAFFEELGIPEDAWIKSCCGIRKEGNVKSNFRHVGDDPYNFLFIHSGFEEWFEKFRKGEVDKYTLYDLYDPNDWRGYAYHIDAAQAWQIVKEYTKDINHIYDEVTLDTLPEADLHIDCTGLKRVLMPNKTLHTYKDTKVDTCIVRRIEEDPKTHSETIGRDYGWEFNVYLSDRRVGCGYVFDNKLITIQQAKEEYMRDNGHRKFLTDFRVLKWEPGRLENCWQDNIVAVGLSAGFIEPMEATSVAGYMKWIHGTMEAVWGERPIQKVEYDMQRSIKENANFILYHYKFGSAYDTPFWEYAKSLELTDKHIDNIIDMDVRTNMITYGFHTSQSVMNMYENLGQIYKPV